MSEEERVSRDHWERLLTVFGNELFSVVGGKCGVDLEFQVSVLGKVGPLTEIRNSGIRSKFGEGYEKISFGMLGLKNL